MTMKSEVENSGDIMDPKVSEWLQEGMELEPETGNILEACRISTKRRGYTIINY